MDFALFHFISVLYVACYLFTVIVFILMKSAKQPSRAPISIFHGTESYTAINETNTIKSKYFDM